ncbi:MAG: hypothetical protein M1833_000704 [Piccolia ochrophora]|nr:MAG: hypothetical protein M1833_000704 [Piccolia ochrophora]
MTTAPDPSPSPSSDTDSDASLFAALEASAASSTSPTLAAHRAARLKALSTAPRPPRTTTGSVPELPTLPSDAAALSFTTTHHRCVLHFTHADFARCAVMDGHLRFLAGAHAGRYGGGEEETRFARVDVGDVPFLVGRLGVRVLPCVMGFVGGEGVGRVVGFEGLGGDGERFETSVLEGVLVRWGVLADGVVEEGEGWEGGVLGGGGRRKEDEEDEDEGDDWD